MYEIDKEISLIILQILAVIKNFSDNLKTMSLYTQQSKNTAKHGF